MLPIVSLLLTGLTAPTLKRGLRRSIIFQRNPRWFDRPDFEKGIETKSLHGLCPPPQFDRPDFEKGIETIFISNFIISRVV